MTLELSRQEARRIAVRAQLLDAYRPDSLLEVVDQLTVLQVDPTAAVAPSADLVAWGRLGDAYDHSDLTFAIETERSLVELGSFVRVMDDVGLLLATLPDEVHPTARAWVEANAGFRADVLARLEAEGPLPASAVPDTCQVPWASSGWTDEKNVVRMLELLNRLGEVAISGRRGKRRTWDLAERVYPVDLEVPAPAEARPLLQARVLGSLAVARPDVVGAAGEACTVEGTEGRWRVDPAALTSLGEPFEGRTALLSPFDRLVHDRDRARELFGFDYVLEMYKPAARRRWGYFALPVLSGDRLIGKLDARADRKAGVLRVHAVHEDQPFDPATAAAVEAEITALADWLGLGVVPV